MVKNEARSQSSEAMVDQSRGERFISRLQNGQNEAFACIREMEHVVTKYIQDGKIRMKYRNPSGDYSVDRIILEVDLDEKEMRAFVEECASVFEKHHHYADIVRNLYAAVWKKKLPLYGSKEKYLEAYDKAMQYGDHQDALMIATNPTFQMWANGAKGEGTADDLYTRALEELAKDALSASKILEDTKEVGWRNYVNHDLLDSDIFHRYLLHDDTSEYKKPHPSAISLEVVKRVCDLESTQSQFGWARNYAKRAHLDEHMPEYYQDLMKRTSLVALLKRQFEPKRSNQTRA
jgi:hypothetical protein